MTAVSLVGALLVAAPPPAAAISVGGTSVPSYNNFCDRPPLDIPVTVCNTADLGTGLQCYGVELRSGTFLGRDDTFEPQYGRTPAYWGLYP